MSSFSLEKNRFWSVDLTAGDQLTTVFTILNCLEYEFLKGFLVQGRQQSFWKFFHPLKYPGLTCLPNIWKIHSQLSAMFTCRDGKSGKLSSQVSKMLYKPLGVVYIASYKEPLDQSDCWKLFVQLWNYINRSYEHNLSSCSSYLHIFTSFFAVQICELSYSLVFFNFYGHIMNSQSGQLPVGLKALLVEHCSGITEVMCLHPVQAWTFFRL